QHQWRHLRRWTTPPPQPALVALRHHDGWHANGDTYEGSYLADVPHGFGEYTRTNGVKFVGQYCQGQRDGHGIETTGAFKKRMVYKDGYLVATTPMASEKDVQLAWRWADVAADSLTIHIKTAEELGIEPAASFSEGGGLLSHPPGAFTPRTNLPAKWQGFKQRPGAKDVEAVKPGQEQPSVELKLRVQDDALKARAKAAEEAANDKRARMRATRSATSFNPDTPTPRPADVMVIDAP
ncbi:hypothetical protein T484DRAFT_1800529, partial [Baffinella frigidus]